MTIDRRTGIVPTLEMVAARAGVSRATVSRVVNGSPRVAPEMAEIVNAAIAELGYVPNRAARSLASRRTEVIALVIPESTSKVFTDPFFSSIAQGAAYYLSSTEYTLSMVISPESDPDRTRRYLMGGNVDGALIVSHHSGDHSYQNLSLPMVFAGRPLHPETGDNIFYACVDDVAGERSATEYLIGSGRRSIAVIAGPQDMPPGLDRLRGWREAVLSHGLDESLVEYGDFTPLSGTQGMRRLLRRSKKIDAVIAANDQMAVGAYVAIAEAGLRIPDDVAVIGFDDDYYSRAAQPPLTTVNQPSIDLGTAMAEMLVGLIRGEPVERVRVLPTQLKLRGSS
jgi:LacI family transcriptional regulator